MTTTLDMNDIVPLSLADQTTLPVAEQEGYQVAMFGTDDSDVFSSPYDAGTTEHHQWHTGFARGCKDWR